MKVIDLLVKIANKEEVPKKIKWLGQIYEYSPNDKFYYQNNYSMYRDFYTEGNCLNDEIEIIEEDNKIDKLDTSIINALRYDYEKNKEMTISNIASDFLSVSKAINELVDEVNKLKENSDVKD